MWRRKFTAKATIDPTGVDDVLVWQIGYWKGARVAADFGLQAIQRAVVLATILAAAKITHSALIATVANVAAALLFLWMLASMNGASRWLRRELKARPKVIRALEVAGYGADAVVFSILYTATTHFADAMAARLSTP